MAMTITAPIQKLTMLQSQPTDVIKDLLTPTFAIWQTLRTSLIEI